ncbi:TPA: hypothetical protein QEM47_000405 [Pseudomonas putida]|uniref:hypothetical protein n=1 Tax=Pseudomonas putida TaxID=303 RepID=UPI000AD2CB97|nr:hypothetical protein [Pseudomonas putida]MDD2116962.1 hypothetical protein [Pseudomonas putida]UPU90702.1 hypothetical protein M0766_17520 [Pseudomonas putida]HDS1727692.1 hypothetical protein [Pseudomonas putida]
MQTTMHPAFQEKVDTLKALLARTQEARDEAFAKIGQGAPRYQASGKGKIWDVIEIATGAKQGFAYSYQTAMRFVDAMEAGAASKQGGMQ